MSFLINVIDIEATCWGHHNDKENSEIIEIGICVINTKSLEIVKQEDILIYPEHSDVSEYCTNLTGLTAEMLDSNGISFDESMQKLIKEHAIKSRTWASWGLYDANQFRRECERKSINNPFRHVTHINIKNLFKHAMLLPKEVDMIEALDILNLYHVGRHHNGLDDCYNISNIFIKLLGRLQDKECDCIPKKDCRGFLRDTITI